MGFDRVDANYALSLTHNDYEMACEYLLNSDSRAEASSLLNYPS